MTDVKALLFDVFGTVVDWRSCIADEIRQIAASYGLSVDAEQLADAWRAEYQPAMQAIRNGQRAFTRLDTLHAENLEKVLSANAIHAVSESDKAHLVKAWHRLKGWPDSSAGLRRLKKKFIIAPQSNGNIALIVNMAKGADLPWDVVLGAEIVQTYKPMPEAYERACDALGLRPQDCMMVAAHNDDLMAARQTGMKTAFVCRPTEHGPRQTTDLSAESDWDICAESFVDLAGQMGC